MIFNETLRTDVGFNEIRSQQIKQAIAEARQVKAKNVLVSEEWFNSVRSVLASLAHPGEITNVSANLPQLSVIFVVDPLLEKLNFEVK